MAVAARVGTIAIVLVGAIVIVPVGLPVVRVKVELGGVHVKVIFTGVLVKVKVQVVIVLIEVLLVVAVMFNTVIVHVILTEFRVVAIPEAVMTAAATQEAVMTVAAIQERDAIAILEQHVHVMPDVPAMRKSDLHREKETNMERYVIHTTKECNCNCLYCYEEDKISEYNWEEIKKIIDDIVQFRTSDEFSIEFLGGEPMLRWDLIQRAYEYMENINGIEVANYTITTNGTLFNEQIINYLTTNKKITVAISLDGHKHSNQLRVFKGTNLNTYQKVVENISILLDNDIDVGIHITTHPYNVGYLSDSIIHLYELGIRYIDIGTIEKTIKIDEGYCSRFLEELDIIAEKIIKGELSGLSVGLFEWIKPYEDIRTYIKDDTGKVVAESYGRSGADISHQGQYNILRCEHKNELYNTIYNLRKSAYDNFHNKRTKTTS